MDHPVRDWTWLILSTVVGAGLALWSLYLVGLVFLAAAAPTLSQAPEQHRMRQATALATLVGFESSLGLLAYLYRFVWYREHGGWYAYLGVLAGLGLLVVGAVLLVRARHAAASARNP